MYFAAGSIMIRPATAEDITHVHAIYTHYVIHTITDLHHEPPSLSSFIAEYETLTSSGLPFLVATSLSESRILGFIHAFPFRGYKIGYASTVELCIMCHPAHTRRGVGSALMKTFLNALAEGGRVELILAFMTVLEDAGEDARVKGFYEIWGFCEVGVLKDVGVKSEKRQVVPLVEREVM